MNNKYRLAFVSNSGIIANAVKSYASRYDDMEIEIHLATMEEAVDVARKSLASGVEVVLGGGATGTLLRHTLGHPAVTIARTHADLLRACIKAQTISSHIGVTSYRDPADALNLFADLLKIDIVPIVFNSTVELVESIDKAIAQGVSCVVGGGICKEIASTHGIEGIVVIPSSEAIVRALDEARAIVHNQRQDREKAARLRCIINSIHEGVLSVTKDGRIDIINRVAGDMLGIDSATVAGLPLPADLSDFGVAKVLASGQEEIDQVRRIAGNDVIVNTFPVRVNEDVRGAVINFGLVSRIRTLDRKIKEQGQTRGFDVRYGIGDCHGDGPHMTRLKERAKRFAQTDAALLIQGETGTGKEVMAQSIHALSTRHNQPFVAINCAALPESLLESELFGYEEGAFTGAKRGGKDGLFVLAHGGTIFLDEIADISPSLQVRLLRVLEEKEIMRVGGSRIIPVDVRVISSSYKNLNHEIRQGNFRADLYFRLAVLTLTLPPLRKRSEDIPTIIRALLRRNNLNETAITPQDISHLQKYAWPGNIRELDTLIHRYGLLRNGVDDDKLLKDLLDELAGDEVCKHVTQGNPARQLDDPTSLKDEMDAYEASIIMQALQKTQYNRCAAARMLGISVNTLWRKMKEYGEDELHNRDTSLPDG